MKKLSELASSKSIGYAFILLASLFSLGSVMGIGPFILGDELIYSFNSRFIPRGETNYGNYLYFQIFQVTEICGEASYQCGKVLNTSIAGLSAAVFYWFFSQRLNRSLTLALSLLFVSGPFVPFLGMFMPEVTFVFFISLSLVLMASLEASSSLKIWLAAGFVYALAAIVKPHAVLLLPALGLYFLVKLLRDKEKRVFLLKTLSLFGSFITSKLAAGFLLAGVNGLNILGPAYESALRGFLERGAEPSSSRSTIAGPVVNDGGPGVIDAVVTQGPLLFLAILTVMGPSVWFLVSSFSSRLQVQEADKFSVRLGQIVFTSLIVMTIVVVGFTGLVTSTGDDHTQRTLFRYVEVLVPLAVGTSALLSAKVTRHYWPALLFILPQIYVLAARPFLVVSSADSTYLRLIVGESILVSFLWILIIPLVLFAVRPQKSATEWIKPTTALFTSVAILASGLWTTSRLQPKITYSSPVLTAANVVSDFSGAENGKGVHFVGNVRTELQGGMLLADMHEATISLKLAGQPISLDELPEGTNWVVSTQEVYYDGPTLFQIVGEKYKVSLVGDLPVHFFGKDMQNGFVTSVEGFGADALNGRWVVSEFAEVKFAEGLKRLSDYSISLKFFCSVDCSDESFSLGVNSATLDLVGGPAGDVVDAQFAIESEDSLQVMTFSLPDELIGKLSIRSVELSPRG